MGGTAVTSAQDGVLPNGSNDQNVPPPTGQVAPLSLFPNPMPYEWLNGMIVFKASIGEGTYQNAILATALPICAMTPQLAGKLFLATEGVRDIPTLLGKVQASNLKPLGLSLGRLTLNQVPFVTLDLLKHLTNKPMPDAPALWVGSSALATMCVSLDPMTRQLTFRDPKSQLPTKSTVVPFEWRDGRIWVQVKVNGKKNFSALLDTTAMFTLLPADVAASLKLTPKLMSASNNGKEGKIGAVELTELAMGDLKTTGVVALYVAEENGGLWDKSLGVIGCDVLLRYRVTIHYPQRKIAFERLPQMPAPTPTKPTTGTKTDAKTDAKTDDKNAPKTTPTPMNPTPVTPPPAAPAPSKPDMLPVVPPESKP